MWLMKTLISVTNKQGMHWINRFKPWDLSQPPLHSDHKENKEFDTVVLKNLYRICNMKRSSTHKITFFSPTPDSLSNCALIDAHPWHLKFCILWEIVDHYLNYILTGRETFLLPSPHDWLSITAKTIYMYKWIWNTFLYNPKSYKMYKFIGIMTACSHVLSDLDELVHI